MFKRNLTATVVAISASLVLAACGSSSSSGSDKKANDKLVYAVPNAPSTLDPATDLTHPVHPLTNESLLKLTADGEPSAGLATEWGYKDTENKVFSLTLREDAKFSDGTPVNAAAVKTWFEYVQKAGGSYVGLMGEIKDIATEGDYTVTITLAKSNPDLALILTDGLSNWGAVSSPEAVKNDPKKLATEPVGAGPYVLDRAKTTSGDTYTFVPNKYYYDQDAINWKEIVVRVITNPSSRLQALQSGEIDGGAAHYSTMAAAEKIKGISLLKNKVAGQSFIVTGSDGVAEKALADQRVRQAMSYAIDRESIAKAIYGGAAEPLNQLPSLDAFDPDREGYPYDLAKAKRLLADAGYADGFDMALRTLDYPGPDYASTAQAVVQAWEDLGITVTIGKSDNLDAYLKGIYGDSTVVHASPQFDRTALMNYRLTMLPGGFFHPKTWQDDKLNAIYEKALVSDDNADLLSQLIDGINEQAYVIPVVVPTGGTYVDSSIKNAEVTNKRIVPMLAEWSPN